MPKGEKVQFAGDIRTASSPEFIARIKLALGLPVGARLDMPSQRRGPRGEALVDYAVLVPIKIEGAEFGVANGVTVDERVTAELRFDSRGELVSFHTTPVDERHLHSVKDHLRKLAAADQIYLGSPGELVDPDKLRSLHKPWYVEMDADAFKRIKRAYIA